MVKRVVCVIDSVNMSATKPIINVCRVSNRERDVLIYIFYIISDKQRDEKFMIETPLKSKI
jgi:hypothetical protein